MLSADHVTTDLAFDDCDLDESTQLEPTSYDSFGAFEDSDHDGYGMNASSHDDATLLEFMTAATWACIDQTHPKMKNILFTRFFKSYEDVEAIASAADIQFAPGLLDIVQSVTPPSVEFFKCLPVDTVDRWAVYAIFMEKDECRSRLYVGVGTHDDSGVAARLQAYNTGNSLPHYVRASLQEDFRIVHKGLLCWTPIPHVGVAPINRLLCYALEATFAYLLWAMRCALDKDWGMGHMCLWDRASLEWDGLCSHSALTDPVRGDFGFTPEEVEQMVIEKKEKARALNKEACERYQRKQMATNRDAYNARHNAHKAEWMKRYPGRRNKLNARNGKKRKENKDFYCSLCDAAFGTNVLLKRHLKSEMHITAAGGIFIREFQCLLCDKDFVRQSALDVHKKSKGHRAKKAAAPRVSSLSDSST